MKIVITMIYAHTKSTLISNIRTQYEATLTKNYNSNFFDKYNC